MEEPGGLQSMGSQRVGHNWVTFHFRFIESKVKTICLSVLKENEGKNRFWNHINIIFILIQNAFVSTSEKLCGH